MSGYGRGLPPGIGGYVAGTEFANRQGANQLGMLQGILQLQALQESQQFNQEMQPLKVAQLRSSIDQANHIRQLRSGIMNGMTGPQNGAPGGDSSPNGQPGGGIPPNVRLQLLSGDPGLVADAKAWLEQNKPIAAREGAPVINPSTGQILFYAPKLDAGVSPQFSGGRVTGASVIPGYADAVGAIKGAEAGASERAKAGFDLVDVPTSNGGSRRMSRLDALNSLGPQQAPQIPQGGAGGGLSSIPYIPPAEQRRVAGNMDAGLTPDGSRPAIPSSTVLGVTPSEAQRAADRERAIAGVRREGEAPQGSQRTGTITDSIDRMITAGNAIINDPALGRSVGLFGAIPSVPGGAAANTDALIEGFKSQISGVVLQSMRDASKTGGAVGNVTEKEWPRLEAMLGALHTKMSPDKFREAASNIIKELQVMRGRIDDAYKQEFGRTPGASPPRNRADILKEYGL